MNQKIVTDVYTIETELCNTSTGANYVVIGKGAIIMSYGMYVQNNFNKV